MADHAQGWMHAGSQGPQGWAGAQVVSYLFQTKNWLQVNHRQTLHSDWHGSAYW